MELHLDLLSVVDHLSVKKESGKSLIFDPLRKKWLSLQPEEFVRQCLILWLQQQMKYPLQKMAIERGIAVNGQLRRYDLLVYDNKMQPWMLIECKAPRTKLSDRVFEQVGIYNWFDQGLKVPYLLITNGISAICSRVDYEDQKWCLLDALPFWGED